MLGTWRACVSVLIPQNLRITTTYMPKSAMTISDDGSLVRYKMFSGLALRLNHFDGQKRGAAYLRSRCTISCSCKYFTPDNMELINKVRITGSLVKGVVAHAPKHRDSILLRELATLAQTLKQLSTDRKLEREIILRPRLKPLVKLHLGVGVKKIQPRRKIGGDTRC